MVAAHSLFAGPAQRRAHQWTWALALAVACVLRSPNVRAARTDVCLFIVGDSSQSHLTAIPGEISDLLDARGAEVRVIAEGNPAIPGTVFVNSESIMVGGAARLLNNAMSHGCSLQGIGTGGASVYFLLDREHRVFLYRYDRNTEQISNTTVAPPVPKLGDLPSPSVVEVLALAVAAAAGDERYVEEFFERAAAWSSSSGGELATVASELCSDAPSSPSATFVFLMDPYLHGLRTRKYPDGVGMEVTKKLVFPSLGTNFPFDVTQVVTPTACHDALERFAWTHDNHVFEHCGFVPTAGPHCFVVLGRSWYSTSTPTQERVELLNHRTLFATPCAITSNWPECKTWLGTVRSSLLAAPALERSLTVVWGVNIMDEFRGDDYVWPKVLSLVKDGVHVLASATLTNYSKVSFRLAAPHGARWEVPVFDRASGPSTDATSFLNELELILPACHTRRKSNYGANCWLSDEGQPQTPTPHYPSTGAEDVMNVFFASDPEMAARAVRSRWGVVNYYGRSDDIADFVVGTIKAHATDSAEWKDETLSYDQNLTRPGWWTWKGKDPHRTARGVVVEVRAEDPNISPVVTDARGVEYRFTSIGYASESGGALELLPWWVGGVRSANRFLFYIPNTSKGSGWNLERLAINGGWLNGAYRVVGRGLGRTGAPVPNPASKDGDIWLDAEHNLDPSEARVRFCATTEEHLPCIPPNGAGRCVTLRQGTMLGQVGVRVEVSDLLPSGDVALPLRLHGYYVLEIQPDGRTPTRIDCARVQEPLQIIGGPPFGQNVLYFPYAEKSRLAHGWRSTAPGIEELAKAVGACMKAGGTSGTVTTVIVTGSASWPERTASATGETNSSYALGRVVSGAQLLTELIAGVGLGMLDSEFSAARQTASELVLPVTPGSTSSVAEAHYLATELNVAIQNSLKSTCLQVRAKVSYEPTEQRATLEWPTALGSTHRTGSSTP